MLLQLLKETEVICGEISNLRWTDIDFEQRTVRVKGLKGKLFEDGLEFVMEKDGLTLFQKK